VHYGVSVAAVEVLAQALQRTGGKQAQFNHPELGGMGQWMPGMVMIGDMFNTTLKARIDGLASELAGTIAASSAFRMAEPAFGRTAAWWPAGLGTPTASGSQNDLHYAYFAIHNRLMINLNGRVTAYDATDYRIMGVSQQQINGVQVIVFQTASGTIPVESLPTIL